jgi:uncharacterized protein with HEPN domain
MSKNADKQSLEFILLMCNHIEEYISEFEYITKMLENHKNYNATLMCLLQIGETLNKLYNDYKTLDKEDIKGAYDVRNFIAHDYMGVDLGLIEFILREKIPLLKQSVQKILEQKT